MLYRFNIKTFCLLMVVSLTLMCYMLDSIAKRGNKMSTQQPVIVKIVTNQGDIKIELDQEKAPVTVANFLSYVDDNFYENTIFHRVIPGFMVQGGGFDQSFSQKSTKEPIKNEADNGLKNARGTLAMARTPDPDSASSQFFINLVDNNFLNYTSPTAQGWGYAVFGKVISGMDVVDKMAKVATGSHGGHQDVPKEELIIESMTRVDPK